MKKASTIFLQAAVASIGILVFVWLLWEPHLEGRNVGATLYQIYFNDWFLAYAYAGSIAFFVAVYQAFRLLGNIRRDKAFSANSVKAVRIVRNCAFTITGFIVPALAYLMIVRPEDDIAGGIVMGLMIIFVSVVVANVANVLEGVLRNGGERGITS